MRFIYLLYFLLNHYLDEYICIAIPNDIDLGNNIDNEFLLEVMMVHRYYFDSDFVRMDHQTSNFYFSMYLDHEFHHLLNPLRPKIDNYSFEPLTISLTNHFSFITCCFGIIWDWWWSMIDFCGIIRYFTVFILWNWIEWIFERKKIRIFSLEYLLMI